MGKKSPSWRREGGRESIQHWHQWNISLSLSTSASSRAEPNRYSALHSSVHPRLLREVWEEWRGREGVQKGNQWGWRAVLVSLSDWIMNRMIIRARLVKLRTNLSSSSANQHAPSSTNQTPTQEGAAGEVSRAFLFALPSASLPLFLCRFFSYNTSSCLRYSCPHLSPWETENSQSHNYRTELSISLQLTLWEERGQGRKREQRRGWEIQIWDEKSHLGPLLFPLGCSHVFGQRMERITPPRDELAPATGGQTSCYTSTGPLSSLPAERPSHCSTNADCMLITSAQITAQTGRKLRDTEAERWGWREREGREKGLRGEGGGIRRGARSCVS